MMLSELSQVSSEALPLEAFQAQLHLGSGLGPDTLQAPVLEQYLRAALAAVEARTGKALLQREFEAQFLHWRDGASQPLPLAPVSTVTGLDMVDAAGGLAPISAEAYLLLPDPHRPVLKARSGGLPAIPTGGKALLRFLAGYGEDWSQVPADLGQAVLMLAAHYYEYRQDVGLAPGCMPFGVASLLESYRPVQIGLSR